MTTTAASQTAVPTNTITAKARTFHSHTHACTHAIGLITMMVTINAVPLSVVHAGAQAIAAGEEHSMVLKTDGTVWATGRNKYGELGDGTTSHKSSFVKVFSGQ